MVCSPFEFFRETALVADDMSWHSLQTSAGADGKRGGGWSLSLEFSLWTYARFAAFQFEVAESGVVVGAVAKCTFPTAVLNYKTPPPLHVRLRAILLQVSFQDILECPFLLETGSSRSTWDEHCNLDAPTVNTEDYSTTVACRRLAVILSFMASKSALNL